VDCIITNDEKYSIIESGHSDWVSVLQRSTQKWGDTRLYGSVDTLQAGTRTFSTLLARVGQHSTCVGYQPWVTPVYAVLVTQPHSPVQREDDYARKLDKIADSGKVTHTSLTCTHPPFKCVVTLQLSSQSKYLE
jgi:hypothetical protein